MAHFHFLYVFFFFFFFNDTATTEIYTLSLHDALPIASPSASRSVTLCSFSQTRTRTCPICRLAMPWWKRRLTKHHLPLRHRRRTTARLKANCGDCERAQPYDQLGPAGCVVTYRKEPPLRQHHHVQA